MAVSQTAPGVPHIPERSSGMDAGNRAGCDGGETPRARGEQPMKALACTLLLALLPSLAVAQAPSVFIADLTWTEVRDAIAAGKTTALYYAGSTEQNGPGVALGKHTF